MTEGQRQAQGLEDLHRGQLFDSCTSPQSLVAHIRGQPYWGNDFSMVQLGLVYATRFHLSVVLVRALPRGRKQLTVLNFDPVRDELDEKQSDAVQDAKPYIYLWRSGQQYDLLGRQEGAGERMRVTFGSCSSNPKRR